MLLSEDNQYTSGKLRVLPVYLYAERHCQKNVVEIGGSQKYGRAVRHAVGQVLICIVAHHWPHNSYFVCENF